MHASLASIGRACTVEDEDPPETPPHNSMDDGLPDQHVTRYGQPLDSGMCLRELVDTSCTLSKSIRFWPVLHKATLNNDSFSNATLFSTVPLESDLNTSDKTGLTSMANTESHATAAKVPGSLDSLTQLHRLCELVHHTVQLDSLANTYSELAPGLISLAAHADTMTSKEYDVLETCITNFSRVPLSPLNVAQSVSSKTSRLPGDRFQDPALASSAYPHSHFRTPVTLNVSQLGELRVLCESLRQCLTQVRLVTHEQHTLTCQLDQLANGTYPRHTCKQTAPIQLLKFNTDWLTSSCVVSAHHLVYSGLSLLAHTDLTRFTHGELWEMMRGMEELDILTRHIQTLHQNSQGVTLRQRLIRLLTIPNSFCLNVELLCDPLFVVSPISVGYLFVLIAHQRALRLSHAVYRQLSAISMCSHRVTQDMPPTSTSASEAKPRLTLVEAFRNYLNEHYDRTTSDYLRAEYEFISGFLDVLSQSTNLLYQVQKLKLVCSAAAAAQAKKTELYRDLHATIPGKSNFDANVKAGSSHAVSVEGKHGILIRKSSGDQPEGSSVLTSASSAVHTNRRMRSGVGHTNIMSQYQDTLHRACTFDRYVATGSILCPLNTADPDSSSEVNRTQTTTDVDLTSSNVPTEHTAANSTSKSTVKKAVQWSDYREISTRHQVIGRFLEMVWRYTETLLNNLFLCPPPQAVVGAQASSGLSLQSTQPEMGSVSLVLTNCLQMPTDKLRRLVCHIREVAKSDIFPVGLVPVLKKQALKLDELAHLRCYYTELSELVWHDRMMTSGHMCNPTNAADVLNTDHPPPPNGSNSITTLEAAECASRAVCTQSHVSPSDDTDSLSANRRGLHAPSVLLDVTSLLHLLLNCLNHFASVDPKHLGQLTARVTQYTKVLGKYVCVCMHLLTGVLLEVLCTT
ncbi:hypothetical protein EG68_08808 [Paragonimus skrjabini miyazakii]|uniref:Uncharacterized protein n=1 Tax=Paragonimus skrjabini miyazakii TaxID=59628 RepID=A0A8S9YP24_9TREM|nr:hypothetical protein EG68_08808 [Paragonimus skrjabini miyazakii]